MSTTTDTSILFEELEDISVPCDGYMHGREPETHDDGPGKHWFQMMHDCWQPAGTILAMCERRSQQLLETLRVTGRVHCTTCGGNFESAADWLRYVGPVKKG